MEIISRLMEQQEAQYAFAALELLMSLLEDDDCRSQLGAYVGAVRLLLQLLSVVELLVLLVLKLDAARYGKSPLLFGV